LHQKHRAPKEGNASKKLGAFGLLQNLRIWEDGNQI